MQRCATIIAFIGLLCFAGTAEAVYQVGQQVTTNFTLYDVYGQQHSLFDYQGMCVMMNFFTLS